jgi:regulator of PEP synthase PpsR (kinase-PPPase family)
MGESPQSTQIFVVSDGTGDTAASVANAAMAQFQAPWRMRRFGGVRQASLARHIIEEAERAEALVVFTLIDEPAG